MGLKNWSDAARGALLVILSTLLYGITPVLAKATYTLGSNGINLAFLRNAFALPVLFFLAIRQSGSLRITKQELPALLLAGGFLSLLLILIYSSYSYITVGTATTLHFFYPLAIMLFSAVVLRQKFAKKQIAGLIMGTAGICCFLSRDDTFEAIGSILAILSGFASAGYMMTVGGKRLRNISGFKLAFWLALFAASASGAFGYASGSLVFSLGVRGWLLTLLISMMLSVGASLLLQNGIRLAGAANASIYSIFEVVSGIFFGMIFLDEELPWLKAIGCLLIITGLVLVIRYKNAPKRPDETVQPTNP